MTFRQGRKLKGALVLLYIMYGNPPNKLLKINVLKELNVSFIETEESLRKRQHQVFY